MRRRRLRGASRASRASRIITDAGRPCPSREGLVESMRTSPSTGLSACRFREVAVARLGSSTGVRRMSRCGIPPRERTSLGALRPPASSSGRLRPEGGSARSRSLSGAEVVLITFRRRRRRGRRRRRSAPAAVTRVRRLSRSAQPIFLGFVTSKSDPKVVPSVGHRMPPGSCLSLMQPPCQVPRYARTPILFDGDGHPLSRP